MVVERKEQTKAVAEDELWKLAFKKLVGWTVKRHRLNPADAEEMVQEAIRLFLTAGGEADPADAKSLLQALGSRINGIAVNHRRKKSLQAVTLTSDGSQAESDDPLNDPPSLEQTIIDNDIARKAVSALLDRVGDDELALSVVMQKAANVDDPAAQAKALGRNVREVYNARRRLDTHADAIERLMRDW